MTITEFPIALITDWFVNWSAWAKWLVEGLLYLFDKLLWLVGLLFNPMIDGFFTVINSSMALIETGLDKWVVLQPYWNAANAWVPIEYGINCVATYYSCMAVVLIWRTIKAHIPTLG